MDELVSKVFKNVIGLDVTDGTIVSYIHGKTLKDVASMLKNGKDYFKTQIVEHFAKVAKSGNNADNESREDLNKEYDAMMHTLDSLKTKNTIITTQEVSEVSKFASEKNDEFNKVRLNDIELYWPSLD